MAWGGPRDFHLLKYKLGELRESKPIIFAPRARITPSQGPLAVGLIMDKQALRDVLTGKPVLIQPGKPMQIGFIKNSIERFRDGHPKDNKFYAQERARTFIDK